MTYWLKDGDNPQALPTEDRDADGYIWTDLENNPHGLDLCGWTQAPDQPDYDPATQTVDWVDGAWAVHDIPAPPAPDNVPIAKLREVLATYGLTSDQIDAIISSAALP